MSSHSRSVALQHEEHRGERTHLSFAGNGRKYDFASDKSDGGAMLRLPRATAQSSFGGAAPPRRGRRAACSTHSSATLAARNAIPAPQTPRCTGAARNSSRYAQPNQCTAASTQQAPAHRRRRRSCGTHAIITHLASDPLVHSNDVGSYSDISKCVRRLLVRRGVRRRMSTDIHLSRAMPELRQNQRRQAKIPHEVLSRHDLHATLTSPFSINVNKICSCTLSKRRQLTRLKRHRTLFSAMKASVWSSNAVGRWLACRHPRAATDSCCAPDTTLQPYQHDTPPSGA